MGPQHIAAENIARGALMAVICRLQWGRSTSLRKTVGAVAAVYERCLASMGPQHIAAENSLCTS